ncbi:MAG: hypothetical protein AB1478_11495 [Nitrospirota bacterium]
MPAIEELEHRVARLESLFENVLKERINLIAMRLDQIYEKTERDKTEILAKTEKDKSEILAKTEKDKSELSEKIYNLYAKTEKDKTEILDRIGIVKADLIKWMIGLLVGFSALIISAVGIILSFALK